MWTYGWSARDLVLAIPATIALIIGVAVVVAIIDAFNGSGE